MAEIREIERFLDRASIGFAGLILEGVPGIGKTRLWRHALSQAEGRGYRTIIARPAVADRAFEFGGLTDLFRDLPDATLAALPRLQREALDIALLRADAADEPDRGQGREPVDERVVAAAVLSVLRLLAREWPLVVGVDDLQWLDQRSARLLGFAGRRLDRDQVGFAVTVRLPGSADDDGGDAADLAVGDLDPDLVVRLRLGSLSLAAMHEVIRSRTGISLHRPTSVRIHEVSAGNPFYGIQLAQAFVAAGGRRMAGESLPVPHALEELVGGRLEAITPAGRRMLLALAALPRPSVASLARVVDDPARLEEHLAESIEAGIVEVDGAALRFSHPLLGAIHARRAPASQRREVHRRIAASTSDVEARAYHLALATFGRDAQVADDLELAASTAHGRRARDRALELLELALAATPGSDAAAIRRRTLAVADAAFEAGDGARARELLEQARIASDAGPERARLLLRLGLIAQTEDFGRSVELLRAAEREAHDDLQLQVRIQTELARFPSWLVLGIDEVERIARSAVELADRIDDRETLAHALALLASVVVRSGREIPHDLFTRAIALEEAGRSIRVDEDGGPSILYAEMLAEGDDPDAARALLERLCERAVSEGDPAACNPLTMLAFVEFDLGRWDAAERVAGEALDASTLAGREATEVLALSALAMVRGSLGAVDEARELGTRGLALANRIGRGGRAPRAALGLVELSLGDVSSAWRWLEPAVARILPLGLFQPASQVADAAEALAGLGRLEEAERLVDATGTAARRLEVRWATAMALRAGAAVAAAQDDLAGAESSLVEGVSIGRSGARPLELGRSLLALGSVRRRLHRKREAHEALAEARSIFERLPAPVWADQARREAARIGGRSRGPVEPPAELSATEREIVALVRVGRTNREIAAALHLSPKTVEWNLTRIYRKVGVRSRTELAALDQTP
jgi:DNA-binding CsgD family transcriptional regulator